jgi:hypothetical protein
MPTSAMSRYSKLVGQLEIVPIPVYQRHYEEPIDLKVPRTFPAKIRRDDEASEVAHQCGSLLDKTNYADLDSSALKNMILAQVIWNFRSFCVNNVRQQPGLAEKA